jgi:hypothetical protein
MECLYITTCLSAARAYSFQLWSRSHFDGKSKSDSTWCTLYYYYYHYYYNHHHHHFLSQVVFLPWYISSWASGEPHHSGFKTQLVALSLWCVMFLVWQFFVGNLLSVVLVLFPDIFINFAYNSGGPNDYWYDKAFHVPHSLNFYT